MAGKQGNLEAVPDAPDPTAVQLELFEGNSITVLRTVFSGNLNGEDADIGVVEMGEKVTLVIEGRIRKVAHSMDKDDRGQRVQTVLVDRIVRQH